MDSLTERDLTIDVSTPSAETICLNWKGKSNDRQPARILTPFFQGILTKAKEDGSAIEMHFEHLDHFNSSTITAIIQLIQDARGNSVRLVIVFDGDRQWQKLSFDALRIFEKPDGLLQFRPLGSTCAAVDPS